MGQPFSPPKVVIVDNEAEDALPMLEALSKIDIPATWYKGTGRDSFPQTPLSGVRLVILDLVLQGEVFDAKQSVGALFNLIAPNVHNGPFFLAIWTEHGERDKVSFLAALEHYNNALEPTKRIVPYSVFAMYKSKFKVESNFKIADITSKFETTIAGLSPLDLLLNWETLCNNAAAVAISKILSLVSMDCAFSDKDHKVKLKNLLDQLVVAAAGKSDLIKSVGSEEYKRALFEPLSYVHEDSLRHLTLDNIGASVSSETCMVSSADKIKVTSALNTILLFDSASLSEVIPGSVYRLDGVAKSRRPFVGDKAYSEYLKLILAKIFSNSREKILEECTPVIIEISPACDFNNNKRKLLRFVCGLIVPHELYKRELNKNGLKAKYVNTIGPFLFEGKAHHLIADSLHLFSMPIKAKLPKPLFRLQSHVLVDVQAWLGGHISRPGHLSL